LLGHAVGVLTIAGICGIVGYAVSQFIGGVTGREVDSRANAEHTFYVTGGLSIAGALIHLTIT
jgi:hypothetical protein